MPKLADSMVRSGHIANNFVQDMGNTQNTGRHQGDADAVEREASPMDQRTQFIADFLRDALSITELCGLCG
jgi:hypothetical protein